MDDIKTKQSITDDIKTKQSIMNDIKTKLSINQELYDNILVLPPQVRNKIYIICMQNYWKKYIPLTSKIPSWYSNAIYQKDLLFSAQRYNIHFLHLPSNTLVENKKYIMGCQCKFCLHDVSDKYKEEAHKEEPMSHFDTNIPYTDSKWNNSIELIYDTNLGTIKDGYTIFNCYYDTYITLSDKIHGPLIEFETIDYSLFT